MGTWGVHGRVWRIVGLADREGRKRMLDNEYKCAICREIFTKTLTEEETIEQLEMEFPGAKIEDCDIICDDCYMKHFRV